METRIGKITSARYGFGGYQDAQFGFWLVFEGSGWGCGTGESFWGIGPSECAKWSIKDQDAAFAKTARLVAETLRKAKKNTSSS